MRVRVCGVKRVEGKAKESGNPFDMCRVLVLVPVETVSSDKVRITGYGYELGEMELAPEALAEFSGLTFPADVELRTEQKFFRGEFKTVCAGVSVAPAKSAKAA